MELKLAQLIGGKNQPKPDVVPPRRWSMLDLIRVRANLDAIRVKISVRLDQAKAITEDKRKESESFVLALSEAILCLAEIHNEKDALAVGMSAEKRLHLETLKRLEEKTDEVNRLTRENENLRDSISQMFNDGERETHGGATAHDEAPF